MGGYDVFFSSLGGNGNWLPPVNIGYPLNTTDDDLFFFPLDTGNIAYQSRYEAYSGQADLVRYTISEFGNPARFMVNGRIDLISDKDYNPSLITVAFIDKQEEDTLAVKKLNDDGSFRQNLAGGTYLIHFSNSTGALFSKDLAIPSYFPHNNLIFHETITIPSVRITDTAFVRPIRFGFDDSRLKADYLPELDKLAALMLKFPDIRLSLNGYTDAVGSEAYNMKLSLMRASSVKEYLAKIPEASLRIEVRAFGESNPVADNQKTGGVDYPEGRQYNRRVEIEIINLPDTLIIKQVKDIPEAVVTR
jgi:outer membrane protein OmpA-like peptidoglycan-associated protein